MDECVRAHVIVSGLVQGVFFRVTACDVADDLGLTGLVRNLRTGDVEIIVEGPRGAIERLISWAHQGPRLSKVDDVHTTWEEATGDYSRFDVALTL
ncbi:MAG: acylphosphatase [Candidatus Undinarchaeales archaeon]|jgi:acylphosphatase|nr:acylphosphatase [Candidatus Undinarchaeales archaeon]MDP7492670.1 acylphosphatase [Candidatus Undinarchaeales archaeon]